MSFIRIRKDALSKPLLETSNASLIEFYDNNGNMNALLTRQFADGMWGLVTELDSDWDATLIRLGYINISAKPGQFISNIKG